MEKRNDKKGVSRVGPRKFPGSGARRKPLAKAKGSYLTEERVKGGLEDCCWLSDTPLAGGLANLLACLLRRASGRKAR